MINKNITGENAVNVMENNNTGFCSALYAPCRREDGDCSKCGVAEIQKNLLHYATLYEQGRLVELLCKEGDTVYRICPKSNDRHDGSCDNCAWAGCLSIHGCTTYGLWDDGQYPAEKCTIVPYKVFWNYIPDLLKRFGKTVFLTREEAEAKLADKGGATND